MANRFKLNGWNCDDLNDPPGKDTWHFYNHAHTSLCGYYPKDLLVINDIPTAESVCSKCFELFKKGGYDVKKGGYDNDNDNQEVDKDAYAPLTMDQMRASKDGFITTRVLVDLDNIIELDFEGFLDLISELSTDSPLLTDIGYKAVGVHTNGCIIIEVDGLVGEILECEDDMDDMEE